MEKGSTIDYGCLYRFFYLSITLSWSSDLFSFNVILWVVRRVHNPLEGLSRYRYFSLCIRSGKSFIPGRNLVWLITNLIILYPNDKGDVVDERFSFTFIKDLLSLQLKSNRYSENRKLKVINFG